LCLFLGRPRLSLSQCLLGMLISYLLGAIEPGEFFTGIA
jgi:hypothetical protein